MSKQTKQTFSIRKYAVGTASVLLGVSALVGATLVSTNNVEAATIVTVLDGVEHAQTNESLDSAEAVEKKGLELIEYYKQYGYKPVDPSTYQPVVGDTFYLRFTKEAEDDRHFTIVVNVDGKEVSRRTHTVNDEAAENLAQEAARYYSDDNKYIPNQPANPQDNVKVISPTEIELTINLVENPRKIKIVDKDGNVSKSEFPAMTETAWTEILYGQIEANNNDTQEYDAAKSYFDAATSEEVLVFSAKEAPKPLVLEVYENDTLVSSATAADEDGLTALQVNATETKIGEGFKPGEILRDGNTLKLYFTKEAPVAPKVEALENFTITLVDGDNKQVSKFTAITHTTFLEQLAALSQAGDDVAYTTSNDVVITRAVSAPVAEKLEDFKIILKVDGKEVQASDFAGISHTDFLKHLSALTEAKLAEGLKQDSVDYDGNVATLSFTTPKKEAKLNENLTTDPLPEYQGELTNPAVKLGNKKASKKSENTYEATKTLPNTGDSSAVALAMAGLAVTGLGLVGLKKRHVDK